MLLEPIRAIPSIAIFGLGHVGLELTRILSRQEIELHLIDSREAMLAPERLGMPGESGVLADAVASITVHHLPVPETGLPLLPAGTHVLVMTHDHAEDLAITERALRTAGLGSIGLIGSKSKWVRFQKELRSVGLDDEALARVTTPDRHSRDHRQGARSHRRERGRQDAAAHRRGATKGRSCMTIELAAKTEVVGGDEILTPEALAFVEELHRRFGSTRESLLAKREERRATAARTGRLDFLAETQEIRDADWTVAPTPDALNDRRVEITGPAESAKMAINALNSGALVWLADLEDAASPTWDNVVAGVKNLRDVGQGHARVHLARGQALLLADRRAASHRRDPSSRLALPGAPRADRRCSGVRVPGRLRTALLPHRADPHRQRSRPVLLPAQDREPSRGAAVERRVRLCPGGAGHPAWNGAGNRPDRDDPGGLRDG